MLALARGPPLTSPVSLGFPVPMTFTYLIAGVNLVLTLQLCAQAGPGLGQGLDGLFRSSGIHCVREYVSSATLPFSSRKETKALFSLAEVEPTA